MVPAHGLSPVRMRSAFTLIELLVVVAILALLIAILLPSLAHARELSKRTIGGTRLKAVGQMIALYASDWNDSPPVGVRSFYGNTIGGSGTAGSGNMVRYMFKVTFTTVGNQRLWRWGVAPGVEQQFLRRFLSAHHARGTAGHLGQPGSKC